MSDDVRRRKRPRLSQPSAPPPPLSFILPFVASPSCLIATETPTWQPTAVRELCGSGRLLPKHSCKEGEGKRHYPTTNPSCRSDSRRSRFSALICAEAYSLAGVKLSAGPFSCHRPLSQNPLPCVTRSRVQAHIGLAREHKSTRPYGGSTRLRPTRRKVTRGVPETSGRSRGGGKAQTFQTVLM